MLAPPFSTIAPQQAPGAQTASPCPRLTPARPPRAENRPPCVSPHPESASCDHLGRASSQSKKVPGASGWDLLPGGCAGGDEPPICWVAPGQQCCFPALSLALHSSLFIPFPLGACLSPPPHRSVLLSPPASPSLPTAEHSCNRRQSPGWMNPLAPHISGTIIVSRRAACRLSALLFSATEGSPYAWAPHGDAEQEGFTPVGWVRPAVGLSSRP